MFLHIFSELLAKICYRLDPIKESRRRGVHIGERCRLVGKIDWGSEPYLISLGDHVSITTSQFITHDGGVWVFRNDDPEIDVIAPIKVGSNVFIGMGCTILPGTTIEDNVVIGASSLVRGHLESNSVYAGVPIKKIKSLEDYKASSFAKRLPTKGLPQKEKKEFLIENFKQIDYTDGKTSY